MCIFSDFQPIRPSSPFRVLRLAGWWTGLLHIHVRSTRAWHVSSLPALPSPWCCAFYSTPSFPLRHSLPQHPSASPSRCANRVMSYHQLGGDTGMTSDDEIVWSVSVWWPGPDPPYRQALTLLLLPPFSGTCSYQAHLCPVSSTLGRQSLSSLRKSQRIKIQSIQATKATSPLKSLILRKSKLRSKDVVYSVLQKEFVEDLGYEQRQEAGKWALQG